MDLSHILFRLGEERQEYEHAVSPPIFQTSNFACPTVSAMRAAMAAEYDSHLYTRGNNPTVEILRRKLAALEGAEDCLVLGSGAAAMAAAVLAESRAGAHVVCVAKPYNWTRTLLRDHLPRFGVETSFIDARDPAQVEAALRENTCLIVLESPNSLTFEQQDLSAIAQLAKARGIRTIVDNSFASPLGQSPIEHGIDVVVHSGTKYLAGHSDVVVGVICGTREYCQKVFSGPFMTLGAVLSPHDAWLVLRGLRTLQVRMDRIGASTQHIGEYLLDHPQVRRVYWPHAPDEPQAELTRRQLKRVSGLLSIELETDIDGVERFCDGLQRFLMAVSWGGYESLALPIAGVRDWRGKEHLSPVPVTLVRLSIGLEDPQVLINDLEMGFARI